MKKVFPILVVVAVIIVGFVIFGRAPKESVVNSNIAKDTTYELKMSTQLNESSPMVQGFKEWSDRVKERTEGAVIITVYPSAQLGSDEDVIEQAIQGVNVAVLTDGGRMANYVKDIGIIGMPYIADNYDEINRMTQTETFQKWEKELSEQNDIRILSFNWYDGPRHFLTNKPITKPADLNGLRIRTPGAPVWSKSVAAMGATPIAMGWTDTYNAVQSKSVDGCEVQHTSSYGSRMYEVLSYINKTAHFHLVNGIIVGEKWFRTLPAEYQNVLIEECKAVAAVNAKVVENSADDFEKKMVDKGMKVIEVDIEAFKTAADSAYATLGFSELRDQIYTEIGK